MCNYQAPEGHNAVKTKVYETRKRRIERVPQTHSDIYAYVVLQLKCMLPAILCLISGFRREVGEYCALLGYYVASRDDFLPTFRENLLSRNVGKKLPLFAV